MMKSINQNDTLPKKSRNKS